VITSSALSLVATRGTFNRCKFDGQLISKFLAVDPEVLLLTFAVVDSGACEERCARQKEQRELLLGKGARLIE